MLGRKCCHRAPNTNHHPLTDSTNLANTARDSRASSPPAGAVHSTRSKATLGETGPDRASVGTTAEGAVGVEDGVAGLDEVGVAGLERHSFHDQLDGIESTIGRHATLECRLDSAGLSHLVNEVPEDFVKHGSPDGACWGVSYCLFCQKRRVWVISYRLRGRWSCRWRQCKRGGSC
jgi:hypothetical protein